jgi:uncharacterized metal-binding protein
MPKIKTLSCTECGQLHCYRHNKKYPDFCLSETTDPDEVEATAVIYRGDSLDAKYAKAAAEVEGLHYCKISRVEEIIAFARRVGAVRIGIASCIGLIEESKIFAKVLRTAGFEPFTVLCKVGSVEKTKVNIDENLKIQKGNYEACCNPILQARLLNREKTDLNVIVGLCVGHDALFSKHSEAPVTTLVTKDRLTGHNPVVTLYTATTYSKRIFDSQHLQSL